MMIGIDASNIRSGGGLTNLIELINGLDISKHEINKIIVWAGKNTIKKIPSREFIIFKSPSMLNGNLLLRTLWQLFFLSSEARKHKCNVLFIPGGSYFGNFKPFVTISQNLLPFEKNEYLRYKGSIKFFKFIFLRLTQSFSFRRADGLIFLTEYAKRIILSDIKKNSGKIKIIPHGINTRFKLDPKVSKSIDHYSESSQFKLLYVSTIDEYKHQWNVVEAVNTLRNNGAPLSLDLVGSSYKPALDKLNKATKKYDPESKWIKYWGLVDYEELHLIYKSADLGIFASSCENMPIILLEKMAAGLPIASSNMGPMKEVLKNSGLFFNPENPDEIAEIIKTYLDSSDLRNSMSQESYKLTSQYSWIRCADDTFSFIIDIAKK